MADLLDTFAGSTGFIVATHTSDSGDAWLPSSEAAIKIDGSGHAYYVNPGNGAVDAIVYSAWTPPSTDYEVEMTIGSNIRQDTTNSSSVQITARHSGALGAQAFYAMYVQRGSSDSVSFRREHNSGSFRLSNSIGGGTTYTLGSNLVAGDVFRLRVQGVGSAVTLSAFRNGVFLYSEDDTNAARIVTAGSAGMGIYYPNGGSTDLVRKIIARGVSGGAAALLFGF